jgi:glucokinase
MHEVDRILVADIGGTRARFGLVPEGTCEPSEVEVFALADYAEPLAAVKAFLTRHPGLAPRQAAFALATPIVGDRLRLTNGNWEFDRREMARRLGLERLLFINDFQALALALPLLASGEYVGVGGGRRVEDQVMAVLGPGTGLGVGAAIPHRGEWTALAGEGGHVSFSPADAFEAEVLAYARKAHGHVSAERLLSGIGLPLLYQAVASVCGEPAQPGATAETLCRDALASNGDTLECRTMTSFCAMLGGVAGNLALTLGARGGVFIGGGMVPRLGEFFFASPFRQRFEDKGRRRDYLAAIPTALITASTPALKGAAYALTHLGATGQSD